MNNSVRKVDVYSEVEPIKLICDKEKISQILKTAPHWPMTEVVERYQKDFNIDKKTAHLHERELKRFLIICSVFQGPIGMRGPVDDLWHTFLLFTEQYMLFSKEVAGRFLHHKPNEKSTSKKPSQHAIELFDKAYAQLFGIDPDPDIWPKGSGECMNGCGGRCGGCNVSTCLYVE